jgi:hypothetical protein
VKSGLKLVALAVALSGAASAPLSGQQDVPKWTLGAELMVGGDSLSPGMLGVHVGRTLLNYSLFSAAVDVIYARSFPVGDKVCILLPPPYVCDTRSIGGALVSSGVLAIGDRAGWPVALRFGMGHYHAKWNGSNEGGVQDPEPSGIMFSGGVAGRIPGLRRHIEAEISVRGFDRLDDKLTKAMAVRLSYRF